MFLFYCLIIGLIIWIYSKLRVKFKSLELPNVILFTGGVKCGKTTMAVYQAIKKYKQILFRYNIECFICKLLKKPIREKPLLYSNIPVGVPYVPLTRELLLRKERFAYGSVCLISEASLVCDSMDYKNEWQNQQLLLFTKLFGHETKGGYLIMETQCKEDIHYAFKRAMSRYYYIYNCVKWIPGLLVFNVREMAYSGNDVINNIDEDLELTMRKVIVPKKYWKMFDCYCYSIMTDSLEKNDNIVLDHQVLKQDEILRLKQFVKEKEVKNNEK